MFVGVVFGGGSCKDCAMSVLALFLRALLVHMNYSVPDSGSLAVWEPCE